MQSYLKDMEFYPFTALLAESINGGYMRVINDGNYDPLLLNLKTGLLPYKCLVTLSNHAVICYCKCVFVFVCVCILIGFPTK